MENVNYELCRTAVLDDDLDVCEVEIRVKLRGGKTPETVSPVALEQATLKAISGSLSSLVDYFIRDARTPA